MSVPGSVMLMGEHAVLHGHPAIVLAVNQYMHLTLTPRTDTQINIQSTLGKWQGKINAIKVESPLSFVLSAIQAWQNQLNHGFDLNIESEFSHTVGLGSSAAVTVATHSILAQYCNLRSDKQALFEKSLQTIHDVQGSGSGADVAASVLGGIVFYQQNQPLQKETIHFDLPLALFYSGSKTPTPDVIDYVKTLFKDNPGQLNNIYKKIAACTENAMQAIHDHSLKKLAVAMNQQQLAMVELGVNNEALEDLRQFAINYPQCLGVKISGSGLGDCLIALGEFPDNIHPDLIPIKLDNKQNQ